MSRSARTQKTIPATAMLVAAVALMVAQALTARRRRTRSGARDRRRRDRRGGHDERALLPDRLPVGPPDEVRPRRPWQHRTAVVPVPPRLASDGQ